MPRRAKIVATLGPASREESVLARLFSAGVDIVRLNLSHGTQEAHREVIHRVRKLSGERQLYVPIVADLMGPRYRLGKIAKPWTLTAGDLVIFGRSGKGVDLPVEDPGFLLYLQSGERILVDNGLIELEIVAKEDDRVKARVLVGGQVSTRKGINLPDTDLPFSITEKDRKDIQFAVEEDVDYLAVSFVGGSDDLEAIREVVANAGGDIPLISKLERATAVRKRNLERVIQTTDAVMVARGDLGVEVPLREVPILQKKIIDIARRYGRPVIVATQMLESMMEHPRPTRAESTDVANAVMDGADALMLSGETAAGKHPIKVVQTMAEIISAAEAYQPQSSRRTIKTGGSGVSLDPLLPNLSDAPEHFTPIELEIPDVVAAAAVYATRRLPVRHIVAFSQSGFTAQMISRYRPEPPITVFTRDIKIARRAQLWWGTRPVRMEHEVRHHDQVIEVVDSMLLEADLARSGDCIIVLMGEPVGSRALTNLMRIHRVREGGR